MKRNQTPGRDGVAILSNALWRDRFASDPNILTRKITLDGAKPVTIVGVMPEEFQYIPMGPGAVFTPLAFAPERMASREARFLHVVGRIKNGNGCAKRAGAVR